MNTISPLLVRNRKYLDEIIEALDTGRLRTAERRATCFLTRNIHPHHEAAAHLVLAQISALHGQRDGARLLLEKTIAGIDNVGRPPDCLLAETLHICGDWWIAEAEEPVFAVELLKAGLRVVPSDDEDLRMAITGSLGSTLAAAGRPAEGRKLIARALAKTKTSSARAELLSNMALVEVEAERDDQALSLHRRALVQAERHVKDDPETVLASRLTLGWNLLVVRRSGEAQRLARICWRQVARNNPQDPYWTWTTLHLLASCADERGRPADAVRHLQAAIAVATASEGRQSTLVAELQTELGELLADHKPRAAFAALEPAVAILSRERGPWHETTRSALRWAARALDGLGREEEAESQYRRLLENTPRNAEDRPEIAADLGFLLAALGRNAEALPYLREAFHRFINDPDFDDKARSIFSDDFMNILGICGLQREHDMVGEMVEAAKRPRLEYSKGGRGRTKKA